MTNKTVNSIVVDDLLKNVAAKGSPRRKTTTTTTKKAPAPAKAPTRKELLDLLKAKGYTGPTSFTATVLADVVAWLDDKAPATKADGIPTGVLWSVHPDLRPAKTLASRKPSKSYTRGYDAAMTDLREFVATAKSVKDVAAHLDAYLTQDVSA